MEYCNTSEQAAYVFTKPLPLKKFMELRDLLGVRDFYNRGGGGGGGGGWGSLLKINVEIILLLGIFEFE